MRRQGLSAVWDAGARASLSLARARSHRGRQYSLGFAGSGVRDFEATGRRGRVGGLVCFAAPLIAFPLSARLGLAGFLNALPARGRSPRRTDHLLS